MGKRRVDGYVAIFRSAADDASGGTAHGKMVDASSGQRPCPSRFNGAKLLLDANLRHDRRSINHVSTTRYRESWFRKRKPAEANPQRMAAKASPGDQSWIRLNRHRGVN